MAKVAELLNAIRDLELVVPEFQREFVWSLEQSKQLMVSLFHKYPTGGILVWSTNNPPEIKNQAIKSERVGWVDVLLDGQQRLTTLYLIIKGIIPPYYTEADISHDPRHLFFNLQTAEFSYYQEKRMQGNFLWQRVTDCFNTEKVDAIDIADKICQVYKETDFRALSKILNEHLNKLRLIDEIDYYKQTVPQGVTIDKAIDIFDRVNSMGTKLTDAELVLTHIGGKWPQVRRVMKQKIIDYQKHGFDFDLDILTRFMVVMLTKSALYEKMTEDVYSATEDKTYQAVWEKLVKIIDYLIPILKQSAYLSGSKDMNTINVLVPIIAFLSINNGVFTCDTKNKFIYWMFLALIWGRYSGQTDQRLDRDVYITLNSPSPVDGLIKEIEDQRGRIEIKPSDLDGRGANHPVHRLLYILAKSKKAVDWANGGSLQDTIGDYYSIQSHHIFPQALLYRNGYDSENHLHKQKVNELANRAFITRDTNFDISDKNPAVYLEEIKTKYPEALKQQLIPEDPALWSIDMYEAFLTSRRKLIAKAINAFLEDLKGKETPEEKTDYAELIKKGENDYVEFKSSLRWDYRQSNTNKQLEYAVAKSVSAFMNSEGGTLVIGVADDGQMLGIDKDMETVKNKSRDGFLLQLTQVINQYLGKEFNQYISIKIMPLDGHDVCIIDVHGSDMPVYLQKEGGEEFFIRASASSQPMSIREANEYIKTHWQV